MKNDLLFSGRMIRYFTLMLWLSFCGKAMGQTFSFERHNFEQGLASSQVLSMDQDLFGHLWMMTFSSDVIYQFDGRKFKHHIIPGLSTSDRFKLIRCGRDEKIYLLTSKYLIVYDGRSVRQISTPDGFVPVNDATFLLDGRNQAWLIGGGGRVFKGDAKGFSEVTALLKLKSRALSIFELNDRVYVISEYGELRVYDEVKGFSPVKTFEGLPLDEKFDFASSDNGILVCSTGTTLYQYDASKGSIETAKVFQKRSNSISRIEIDPDGGIWILRHTQNYEASFVDYFKGNTLTSITSLKDFTQAFVIDLFKDSYGTIWFLTDGDGLIELKKYSFESICREEVLPTRTMQLDGALLMGSYRGGMYEIQGGQPRQFPAFEILEGKSIADLDTVRDQLLISTIEKCIYEYNRKLKTTKRIEINSPPIRTVEPDGDSLILGTNSGVYVFYQGAAVQVPSHSKEPLVVSQVLKSAPGRYLVATQNAGLYTWIEGDSLVKVDSVKATFISSLRKDNRGRTWVSGDNQGLWSLDDLLHDIRKIDLDPSMDRFISNIEFINDSTLLLGGMTTLYQVGLIDFAVKRVRRFAKTDGFTGGDFFVNSFRSNLDNSIDILTSSAYRYYPERDRERKPLPTFLKQVIVTNLKGKVYAVPGIGFYQIPSQLRLDKAVSNLTIDFAMMGLRDTTPLYQYILEGQEEDWSIPNEYEQIIFRHLAPGKYTFRVRSSLDRKEWGSEARFQFEILPAFWETPYFVFSILGAGLLLLVVMIRVLSTRKLNRYKELLKIRAEESEKLRKQMAMDFHDEMGNKLASMLAYSELMKVQGNDRMERSQLDHFSNILSEVYSGTRDFIWSIDLKSNNLREILGYLRDYGSVYFEKHRIRFLVENDILSKEFEHQLPEGYNRQVVLIFREAMSNIVKHAHADSVIFNAEKDGHHYIISIKDNGQGFSPNHVAGTGLTNMAKRATSINAQLLVKSNHGVQISLILYNEK